MVNQPDQLYQGQAYFVGADKWNTPTPLNGIATASSPNDTLALGVPHTQTFHYQLGTPSTALASGVFYSASGTATLSGGTLTGTGVLVSAGVAVFDVPRGIRLTASVNLSTTTFNIVGTDGYGQTLNYSMVGPTGDTIGNTGSYVDSAVAFKTVTASAITLSNMAASGTSTTLIMIGDNNAFGLPYVLANVGMGLGAYINGSLATIPPTFQAAYTPTGVSTATTVDVRGMCTLATAVLANDARYVTIGMIQPPVNLNPNTDTKVRSFGAAPFGS